MRAQWVRVSGVALILSITIAGCGGDRATGVQPVSAAVKQMKMQALPDTVTVATRLVPLEQELSASAVIGPEGGTLQLPEAGLRVTVPKNAVGTDVTFTVKALPGAMLAYEFGSKVRFDVSHFSGYLIATGKR